MAISIEKRNHYLYSRLGDVFGKLCSNEPRLQAFFYDLAANEREHGTILQEQHVARYGTVHSDLSEDEIVESIEVPRLNLADILQAVESGDMESAIKLSLEMAVETENRAVGFYSDLVRNTTDPELKAVYEQLLEFEQAHVEGLTKVPGGSS
jgi:rubrerythrin